MRKPFCDICEKEIKSFSNSKRFIINKNVFILKIEFEKYIGSGTGMTLPADICEACLLRLMEDKLYGSGS